MFHNEEDVRQYCLSIGLPEQAWPLMQEMILGNPVRRVDGSAGNVTTMYASRKNGVTIQAESHRVEMCFLREYEYDDDIVAVRDQPYTMTLRYVMTGKREKVGGTQHTPDYLVLRKMRAGFEECKPEAKLLELAETMPHRYVHLEDGSWDCPPGREWASQYGLYYRIRSSAEICWALQDNLIFLAQYLHGEYPSVEPEVANSIKDLIRATPGISLAKLLAVADNEGFTSDDIYKVIVTKQIYFNIREVHLNDPSTVSLFSDECAFQAYSALLLSRMNFHKPTFVTITSGTIITWDGNPYTVIQRGDTAVTLSPASGEKKLYDIDNQEFDQYIEQGKIQVKIQNDETRPDEEAMLLFAELGGPEELKEALRRLAIIRPDLEGREPTDQERITYDSTPSRTRRHWRQKYRIAEIQHGYGFLGLLPGYKRRGNRNDRLPEDKKQFLIGFISSNHENIKQKTPYASYCVFRKKCEEKGFKDIPAYVTFLRYIKKRSGYEQSKKRKGRRGAYKEKPWILLLDWTTPRQGSRPFERAYIDHTQLDVELICSQIGTNLGRPWITLMIDAFSRRILAFYITFDEPSYRSCMMVLRECVRRHQRLPEYIIVDWGAEFESTYFEVMLAALKIHKVRRPKSMPRFGSVMERIFNTLNKQYIHTLAGNTQIMKCVRMVTKSVEPKNHACWTLEALDAGTEKWAYDVYDNRRHETLNQSPRRAFEEGMKRSGMRDHEKIYYTETFRIFTLPTTKKQKAKVQPNQGVKINRSYYWSEAFRDPEVINTEVHIRYDPFNYSVAYALVKNVWVECISDEHRYLQNRSEREIKLATTELRRLKKITNKDTAISSQELGEFLISEEAKELLLIQQLQDNAARNLRVSKNRHDMENQFQITSVDEQIRTDIETKHDEADRNTSIIHGNFKSYEDYPT